MYRSFMRFYWLATGLLLSLLVAGLPFYPSLAQNAPTAALPTAEYQGALIPDLQRLTFGSLPPLGSIGEVRVSDDIRSQLKYNPDRTWERGDSPASVSLLGDFSDSFELQKLSLDAIASGAGFYPGDVSLDKFGVFKLQNLESLTRAIPELLTKPVKEVLPVKDLLKGVAGIDPNQTIEQVLSSSPTLGNLEFSTLLHLGAYKVSDVPGLSAASIGAFHQWQGVPLNKIAGLPDLPWNNFPEPLQLAGSEVGSVDIAFQHKEQKRDRSISGSDQAPRKFNEPCEENCASIELGGSTKIAGTYWISGEPPAPWVPGGYGVLGEVGGGKEPHGRFPFGPAFKVVITKTSEQEGTADFSLYTKFCVHGTPELGCTPYIVGPIPFLIGVREKSPIFLGAVELPAGGFPTTANSSAQSPSLATPQNLNADSTSANRSSGSGSALPKNLSFLQSQGQGDCRKQHQGVVLDALALAFSSIEGSYDSVGPFVCDPAGNCGRGLGTSQFMSYRQDVQQFINSKSDGKEFLAKVASGVPISGQEVLAFFPPADQDTLFDADATNLLNTASQQIDPQTGRNFTRDRLVERVAQMHFGGVNIPIDSTITDANGRLTVNSYGQTASNYYQQFLTKMGCS